MSEIRSQILEYRLHGRRDILPYLVFCIFCLLTSVFSPLIWAEEFKVAYVDMAKLFDEHRQTASSGVALERKGEQKQAELEGRMDELRKLREGLELLSDDAREKKRRKIEAKADALKRFRSDTMRDLQRERNEIAENILQDISRGVAEYANANGLSLVIYQRSVIYGDPAFDATEDILKLLNRR